MLFNYIFVSFYLFYLENDVNCISVSDEGHITVLT